jgi:hypothetical protein
VGACTYVFNPSEIYQRTKPGQGVETTCGALTFPAVDDPEIVPVRMKTPGVAEVTWSYLPTGKMQARSQDDPYCPAHGGSPEPPPPPVTMADLQAAHDAYLELAARFEHGQAEQPALQGVPLPALAVPAGQDPESPVTADQLRQASEDLAELAARATAAGQPAAAAAASAEGVSDE